MTDASINSSTCKKFLMSGGLRVSKDAVVTFQRSMNLKCVELGKNISVIAESNKRKTILAEDVEKALS